MGKVGIVVGTLGVIGRYIVEKVACLPRGEIDQREFEERQRVLQV